jgi:hypothetical protein
MHFLAEPLFSLRGAPGFRGTPFGKHCPMVWHERTQKISWIRRKELAAHGYVQGHMN